jgi:hypothetical protein
VAIKLLICPDKRTSCDREIKLNKWRSLVQAFDVEHVYILPLGLSSCFSPNLDNYSIIESVEEIDCSYPKVFVEKDVPTNRNAIELTKYNHPADALYCFGSDSKGFRFAPPNKKTDLLGDWVTIPNCGRFGLWAQLSATIVLYDRVNNGKHNR